MEHSGASVGIDTRVHFVDSGKARAPLRRFSGHSATVVVFLSSGRMVGDSDL